MMVDLISLLEQAESGSRELDARIGNLIDFQTPDCQPTFMSWKRYGEQFGFDKQVEAASRYGSVWHDYLPSWTTSIDDAVTLIPDGWVLEKLGDGASGIIGSLAPMYTKCDLTNGKDGARCMAGTRPLAICLAALKARASMTEKG